MMETLVVAGVCVIAMACVFGIAALHTWYCWGMTRKWHDSNRRTLQANLALSERPNAQVLAHKQEDTEQIHARAEAANGQIPNHSPLSWKSPEQRARDFAGG